MEFFLSEVFPASSITDVATVSSFYEDCDALAVGLGNRLVIYKIEDQFLHDPRTFELYGEINRVIPIQYSHATQGNLLVILDDLQVCILSADENDHNKIKTVSTGTLSPTSDAPIPKIKHALHPNAVVLQLSNTRLDVFPITSNCKLSIPFFVEIGCKRIIDFHFIGPTAKVTRLAVLTEEFNKANILRLIEIDSLNNSFIEDPEKNVTLPPDTYLLVPYDPENQAIIVAFSTQRAIRVLYNNLTPQTTTATIFTNVPLTKLLPLKPNFYMAIDQANNLRVVKLEKEGNVHFIDVAKCPRPSAIAAISSTLAFIGSELDDSIIYNVEEGVNSSSATVFDVIKNTGPAINFFQDQNKLISIFEKAVIESQEMYGFKPLLKVSCSGFSNIFPFFIESKEMSCFVLSSSNYSKILSTTIDGEYLDYSNLVNFCYNEPTIAFKQLDEHTFLQITNKKIIKFTENNNQIISIDNPDDPNNIFFKASIWNNKLAVSTQNSIQLYDFQENIIAKGSRIVPNGIITALAISESYLAYATTSPSSIIILHTNSLQSDFKTITVKSNVVIIDLLFHCNTIFALHLKDKFSIFNIRNTKIVKEIINCGFHSQMRLINENQIFVCGSNPMIINAINNSQFHGFPLKVDSLNSAIYFNEQLILLNTDSLTFGTLTPPKFVNFSLRSQMPLIDIFKMKDKYISVKKVSPHNEALFLSSDKYEEGIEPFYVFQMNNCFTGYYIEKDYLFIGTNQSVIKFQILDETIQYLAEASISGIFLTNQINTTHPRNNYIYKIGTFRDYMYIQNYNQVIFYTADISTPHECILYPMIPPLVIRDEIIHFACNNQIAAIVNANKTVIIYSYDDFHEKFIPIPSYQSPVEITALSISGTKIICAAANGVVLVLGSVCSFNSAQTEHVVQVSFSIGERITSMRTFPDKTTILGTRKGKVMILRHIKANDKLYSAYEILTSKLQSIGRFTKRLQRYPKIGRYILPGKMIYDLDLIKRFNSLTADEQEKIFKNSTISASDARHLTEMFV